MKTVGDLRKALEGVSDDIEISLGYEYQCGGVDKVGMVSGGCGRCEKCFMVSTEDSPCDLD